jgi:cytochrome c-type biogenesis protein CcmF
MIPTIGHAAVLLALALSIFAVAAFVVGARAADERIVAAGRRATIVTFGLALIGCAAMVVSLLGHDFSVLYVVRNNATTTPPFYSVISLWAALEGSILFWTLLATGWSALILHRYRARHPALMPWAGAVLATVNAFFFAVMTWPSDPFTRVMPVAAEGAGPNALLQNHPLMGLHPPLLYLGYTGLAVPFALGVAAMIAGRAGDGWLSVVRRWTLIPWTLLSLGIVAGAWWAYQVLGWGGYWFWDPVENAALLPWLTATAFVHSSMVAERRGGLRTWTLAMVIATFTLTLLGTFLTRSGVIESVHAFTESSIGAWFAAGVLIALAGGLGLLVWRLPDLRLAERPSRLVSRETAFLFNNLLFLGLTFVVLFGTFLPLLVELTAGDRISIGRPYFDRVGGTIFVAILFLMAVGPALPWGGAGAASVRRRLGHPTLVGAVAALGAWVVGMRQLGSLAAIGLAGFVAVIVIDEVVRGARARARRRDEGLPRAGWGLITRNRRRYGGYAVHLAIALMAVAVAVSSELGREASLSLAPGERAVFAGYGLTFEELRSGPMADDQRVIETAAIVRYDGPQSGVLAAASRDYPNAAAPIGTPGVRSSLTEDLYVTLLGVDPDSGAISLQVFVKPMVIWIWIGGALVALAAAFAIWPDRRAPAVEDAARAEPALQEEPLLTGSLSPEPEP